MADFVKRRFFNKMFKRTLNKNHSKYPQLNSHELSLLFVHVPKTAGTSFRNSLVQHVELCMDYGSSAAETSKCVKKFIYEKNDVFQFQEQFRIEGFQGLTGHFPLAKYIDLIEINHSVMFLREPFQQLLSHYNHHVNHLGFAGSIERFMHQPRNVNFQFRQFSNIPVELVGLVGVTEKYEQSLELINHTYNFGLDVLRDNANLNKVIEIFPEELREQFEELNKKDISLYTKAVELHAQRLEYLKQDKTWTHLYARVNKQGVLTGCAYQAKGSNSVEIEIYIDGTFHSSHTANKFFGLFPKVKFPRNRYIGFGCRIAGYSVQSKIEIKVCSSGQIYQVQP